MALIFKTGSLPPSRAGSFTATHWSVVLAAGRADSPAAHDALARLCRDYWQPLYTYVRRRGHDAHDAQDLTQEFFARLLEKDWLKQVQSEKGKNLGGPYPEKVTADNRLKEVEMFKHMKEKRAAANK